MQKICNFAPFGRIVRNTMTNKSQWKYHYTIADHLGNARVEFVPHNGGQPEVVQSVSYYPFGYTLHCNDYGSRQPNRHLFGGKELQDQTLAGITFGWYDFEARMYDPAIGRFMQTDPMAEKYYWISPYAYCANNPIRFIDPTGMKIKPFDEEAKEAWEAFREKVFDKDYEDIKEELLRLEEADEVFCIRMGKDITNGNGGGNFIYNKETGEFDVNISSNGEFTTMEKLAHELKHADQYMEGKLGFDLRGDAVSIFAYDFLDEVEAFERQGLFGNTLTRDEIKRDYNDLWNKGVFKTNKTIYDCAHDNPARPFFLMRKANSDSYNYNKTPVYLYHGWKEDIK